MINLKLLSIKNFKNRQLECGFSAINYNLLNPFLITLITLSVVEKYKELKDLLMLYLENFSFKSPLIHGSIVDVI